MVTQMNDDLKELLSIDSSLMEVFKEKAAGTFRHCQNVASLCESVATEMDVDSESLIIAAKLHDIGKTNNPIYFSENQPSDTNPHDELDPAISYQYISRHVADSVLKLIQISYIPKDVIVIVSEHHGDCIIGAIYNKAKELYNGSTVPDNFRYKNRKPTKVESAVLMICDVVESACRSLHNSNKLKDPKETIDRLVNNLIDDEQLDILTIGHLRTIRKVLYKEIESTFHKRVDYEGEE
jgi:putative nucleotidyltransferase with HDIG domain